MQRGADKLRARCFMKQHASRDARVPGSLAAQPRPASVAPSAGGTTASRPDRPTPRHSSVSPRGRVHPRDGRTTSCALWGAPLRWVRHLQTGASYCGIEAQHSKYWNIYWVLICVAVHKVRYRVRHFGGVFIFPVSKGRISILMVKMTDLVCAARDF